MSAKNKDIFVLKGELADKLSRTKSYFATRYAITEKLLKYEVVKEKKQPQEEDKQSPSKPKGDKMFLWVGDCDIDEEKFTVPVKIQNSVFNQNTDGLRREQEIKELGMELEKYFGLGQFAEEEPELDDWIVPISHITGFEQKNFEE